MGLAARGRALVAQDGCAAQAVVISDASDGAAPRIVRCTGITTLAGRLFAGTRAACSSARSHGMTVGSTCRELSPEVPADYARQVWLEALGPRRRPGRSCSPVLANTPVRVAAVPVQPRARRDEKNDDHSTRPSDSFWPRPADRFRRPQRRSSLRARTNV